MTSERSEVTHNYEKVKELKFIQILATVSTSCQKKKKELELMYF